MNFSVPSREVRAASYKTVVFWTRSRQFVTGWTLTSITPGSGVTLIRSTRLSQGIS